MNIYVCARWGRRDELAWFAHWVERRLPGCVVTSGWVNSRARDDGELAEAEKPLAAERDLAELRAADVVVAFTEGPEPVAGAQRGGRHVELGAALALGKRIFIVGPRENIFCWLPAVRQVEGWWQVIDVLADAAGRRETMHSKFDFGMALACLRDGQQVTREGWKDRGVDVHISLYRPDGDNDTDRCLFRAPLGTSVFKVSIFGSRVI